MRREVELTDPRALRALAHPLRVKLLGLLRLEGPLTASDAGRRVGESSGSASYHLRQLERFGLVEEAEGGWAASAVARDGALHLVAERRRHPRARRGRGRVRALRGRRLRERLERWLERRRAEPEEWQEAAVFGDSLLYLTVDELAGLRDALQALADPYLERIGRPDRRPPGTRPVKFLQIAFPEDRS